MHILICGKNVLDSLWFHSCSRQPSETIATFISELRSIAEFCNFGQTLGDMLRDRLVCGIWRQCNQEETASEGSVDLS